MSCHADNKPQGWYTSLAFVAISQLHFHNNSVSYFPGGLWLTMPEKITVCLLLSKMKGVGLSPAKCGGPVEEGKQLSWRDLAKPLGSGVVGGSPAVVGSGRGRLSPGAQQQGHRAGHRQHGVAVHSPAISQADRGPEPAMGQHGWMPSRVGGGKMAPLCFQHNGWVLWHRFVILAALAMNK